jgi:hypothetical protein
MSGEQRVLHRGLADRARLLLPVWNDLLCDKFSDNCCMLQQHRILQLSDRGSAVPTSTANSATNASPAANSCSAALATNTASASLHVQPEEAWCSNLRFPSSV